MIDETKTKPNHKSKHIIDNHQDPLMSSWKAAKFKKLKAELDESIVDKKKIKSAQN